MKRKRAIELLKGFINLHTEPAEVDLDNNRALYHEALSVLEKGKLK